MLYNSATMLMLIDLRDDQQFFVDHPGAVPISTAQVLGSFICFFFLRK
uniref:Uncharacterized protein n=1 Tax=Aegilops tauschii subsp. strangulata TaxID=200361 RepID=A0A452ZHF6_AEGTS